MVKTNGNFPHGKKEITTWQKLIYLPQGKSLFTNHMMVSNNLSHGKKTFYHMIRNKLPYGKIF